MADDINVEVASLKTQVAHHEESLRGITAVLKALEKNLREIVRLETQQANAQASIERLYGEVALLHKRIASVQRELKISTQDVATNSNTRQLLEKAGLLLAGSGATLLLATVFGGGG